MVPAHLITSYNMLDKAFPHGVPDAEYMCLLTVLYPYFSDENLGILISEFCDREIGFVTNDILAAGAGGKYDCSICATVQSRLVDAGYREWLEEGD